MAVCHGEAARTGRGERAVSCGTDRGVKAHKGRNEPPCKFCRKFMDGPAPSPVVLAPVSAPVKRKADRDVQLYKARPVVRKGPRVSEQIKVTRPPVVCGTDRGYLKHKRQPEDPCSPCQTAHVAALAELAQERAAAAAVAMAEAMATAKAQFPDTAPREPRPARAPRAQRPSRELMPCGTPAGRARHVVRKEPVCDPCRLAYNAAARAAHAKRTAPMDRSHIVCGTVEGYGRHTWLKEPACRLCLDAKAAASRAAYVRKTEPLPPAECGTTRGYRKHTTDKTPYCQPCRNAYNQRRAERRAEQKEVAA